MTNSTPTSSSPPTGPSAGPVDPVSSSASAVLPCSSSAPAARGSIYIRVTGAALRRTCFGRSSTAYSTMKSARGEITINGFYDDVRSPTLLERKALAALPYDPAGIREELDVARLDTPRDRPIADRLAVWPTQTINGLHGGYAREGTKTVLPCEAMAKCDMRLVVGQIRDDALAKVEAHVRKHAPNAEFVPLGGMDPSKTPLDSPFADPVRRGMVEAQGEDPLIVPTLGGGLPDYVFTKILGIPAFGAPYANRDEANHAPNENLDVERFFAGIRTGVAILSQLGAMANPHGA